MSLADVDLVLNGHVHAGLTLVRWPTRRGRLTKWHVPEKVGGELAVVIPGMIARHSGRMEVLMRCGVSFSDDEVAEWNVEQMGVDVTRGWTIWPRSLIADTCGVCLHALPRTEANWLYAGGRGSLLG